MCIIYDDKNLFSIKENTKMKKIICFVLLCTLAFCLFACIDTPNETTTNAPEQPSTPEVTVMSWEEYVAAEVGSKVVIEAYVQGHQSWWDNKISVYAQDENGGYFLYDFPCSQETAEQLVPGTKIRVFGYKAAWAGELELVTDEMDPDYAKIEIVEGQHVATPIDVTSKLGTEDLVNYQNMLVEFKGLTFKSLEYKNGAPGDDIYVTFDYNGGEYSFCVERYLTGPETDLYTLVGTLKEGDVVDVVGFAYWYNGINTHITSIVVK